MMSQPKMSDLNAQRTSASLNLRGEYRRGESLARHCSWRCGGPADHFFEPADRDDLIAFLTGNGIDPLLWLGLGSNLLIRDGGVRGTVISTAHLDGSQWPDAAHLYAEAGLACARIARLASSSPTW